MTPGFKPVRAVATSTFVAPVPALRTPVREPYELLPPYSTYQFVAWPPGLIVPTTVAVVAPSAPAGPVTAVGAATGAAPAAETASASKTEAARRVLGVLRTAPTRLRPFR